MCPRCVCLVQRRFHAASLTAPDSRGKLFVAELRGSEEGAGLAWGGVGCHTFSKLQDRGSLWSGVLEPGIWTSRTPFPVLCVRGQLNPPETWFRHP